MSNEPDFGVHDGPYVGGWMVEANTGLSCQVEEVLDDGWFQVRLEDGRSVRLKARRPTADELPHTRGS